MKSLKSTYENLTGEREGFLSQAEASSEITIPSLIPPDETSKTHNTLYKPFQSIGAFGVNALANKLTGALYPATEPFFRFEVNTSSDEMENVPPEALAAMDAELSGLEQRVLKEFTKRGDRAAITEAVKHLVVGGNAVLYVGEERTRVYSLNQYVAVRDGAGNLLKVVTKDSLSYETFKESYPGMTEIHAAHQGNRNYVPKTIDVYTCMYRENGMWYVVEEAAGKIIGETKQSYPLDQPPYLVLRFNRIDGQSYGRGYVENLFGDLRSLELLSRAMVEGSAINARVLFLVNPNGFTSMIEFEEADNGAVIAGSAGDITTAKVDKGADLAVTSNEIARLEQRLAQAFMLTSGMQRDAERVTATEVNAVAAEVEQILGGVYSVLSEEFQRPFVTRLVAILKKKNIFPEIREGLLDIGIVTGTSAIGRGIDRERMLGFVQALTQTLGGEVIQNYVNVSTAISRLGAAFGIDLTGLVKTPEELAAEQQQAQQMQMAQSLGPQAIAAAGQVTQTQMKGEQDANKQEQV